MDLCRGKIKLECPRTWWQLHRILVFRVLQLGNAVVLVCKSDDQPLSQFQPTVVDIDCFPGGILPRTRVGRWSRLGQTRYQTLPSLTGK